MIFTRSIPLLWIPLAVPQYLYRQEHRVNRWVEEHDSKERDGKVVQLRRNKVYLRVKSGFVWKWGIPFYGWNTGKSWLTNWPYRVLGNHWVTYFQTNMTNQHWPPAPRLICPISVPLTHPQSTTPRGPTTRGSEPHSRPSSPKFPNDRTKLLNLPNIPYPLIAAPCSRRMLCSKRICSLQKIEKHCWRATINPHKIGCAWSICKVPNQSLSQPPGQWRDQLLYCDNPGEANFWICSQVSPQCIAVYLSICLSVCLSVGRSISIYLSLFILIYLYLSSSISIYLHLSLSIYIYLHLSLSTSISLYLCLSISIYLSLSISIYLSICRSIYLLYLSLSIYIFIYIYLYLSIFLSISI